MKKLLTSLIVFSFMATLLSAQNPASPSTQTPSGILEKEHLEKALDFFVNFADACHHRKEEEHYFPEAEAAGGMAQQIQASGFLNEHEYYRMLLYHNLAMELVGE